MKYNDFIEKVNKKHNGKYTYEEFNDKTSQDIITIYCPEHGVFQQKMYAHIKGQGCPKCNGGVRMTTEEFIQRAKEIHGDRYDYSKVEYKNKREKVCIVCPIHGEFWQSPPHHLRGCKCPSCSRKTKSRQIDTKEYVFDEFEVYSIEKTEKFIDKANKIHNNKYDYSKTHYKGPFEKVCVICPEHGEFWQSPNNHLRNHGCPNCSGNKKIEWDEFIEKANKKHNDFYKYKEPNGNFSYYTLATIICPIHGEFQQMAGNHLIGCGCGKCAGNAKLSNETFVEKAIETHGLKYDYSKVDYQNSYDKVQIICPEHGAFWQAPASHISGQGCPVCKQSHLESEIMTLLEKRNIPFVFQKTWDWLKDARNMPVDFYLPSHNLIIECQGIQHFEPVDIFGGKEEFDYMTNHDVMKYQLCSNKDIPTLYYVDEKHKTLCEQKEFYNDKNIAYNKDELIQKIETHN